jgi:hypothetical protein
MDYWTKKLNYEFMDHSWFLIRNNIKYNLNRDVYEYTNDLIYLDFFNMDLINVGIYNILHFWD